MTYNQIDTTTIMNVKVAGLATTYETRIKSDGKVEATDTVTPVEKAMN